MAGKIDALFPSYLLRGRLRDAAGFNRELAREILALEGIDAHGRSWSQEHFVGGYSSYSSYFKLHETSPNFLELANRLKPFVKNMVKKLHWDLQGRSVEMTTCWVNSMGPGTYHGLHLHPNSVLSGVYYVTSPPGSSPLKLEDPRLGLMMNCPPRKLNAPKPEQNYLRLPAKSGHFFIFESWMRHEVPPHRGTSPRLSVSFNYETT